MDPWEFLRENCEQYSDAEFWDILVQESYEPSAHSAADCSNPKRARKHNNKDSAAECSNPERADSHGHSPPAPSFSGSEADWAMIMDDDDELNEIRCLCQLHKYECMDIEQLLGLADPKFECTDEGYDSLLLDESRKNLDDIENDLLPSEDFSVDYYLNPGALLATYSKVESENAMHQLEWGQLPFSNFPVQKNTTATINQQSGLMQMNYLNCQRFNG